MEEKDNKDEYYNISPIQRVFKKMKKEYDKDPKDWAVVSSKDDNGNADTFFQKKPNTYWLKSKMLSPYSALSLGTVIKDINKEIDEKVGQKLTPEDMIRFFGMVVPVTKDQNVIAAGIEKYSQNHGDILKTIINEKETNVGYQLARRLDEEFTKQYPQRKNLYI
jgi:hypothetical protein